MPGTSEGTEDSKMIVYCPFLLVTSRDPLPRRWGYRIGKLVDSTMENDSAEPQDVSSFFFFLTAGRIMLAIFPSNEIFNMVESMSL